MKKAEDYINVSELSYKSNLLKEEIIKKWINKAQIDTIEATVLKCAQEAIVGYVGIRGHNLQPGNFVVNQQSILRVAEQLKKELE